MHVQGFMQRPHSDHHFAKSSCSQRLSLSLQSYNQAVQTYHGGSVPSDRKQESGNTFEEQPQWPGLELKVKKYCTGKVFFRWWNYRKIAGSFYIYIAVTYLQFLVRFELLVFVEKQFLAVAFCRFFFYFDVFFSLNLLANYAIRLLKF